MSKLRINRIDKEYEVTVDNMEKERISDKKRIRMRGLWIPKLFLFILGFIHSLRHMISIDNGFISSPYTDCVKRNFEDYCSKMYRVSSQYITTKVMLKEKFQDEVASLEGTLSNYKAQLNVLDDDTVDSKRRRAYISKCYSSCVVEYNSAIEKCKQIVALIDEAELETLEIINSVKNRAETGIVAYMNGAGTLVSVDNSVLSEKSRARELYIEFMSKNIKCEMERKDDDYEQTA